VLELLHEATIEVAIAGVVEEHRELLGGRDEASGAEFIALFELQE